MNNTPRNTTVKIDDELRQKWERYERIQYDKISQRHELAKKVAMFCAMCTFGMLGLASTHSGREGTNRVVAAAVLGLTTGGIMLVQKPLDNKTFKRLQQERKYWFGFYPKSQQKE